MESAHFHITCSKDTTEVLPKSSVAIFIARIMSKEVAESRPFVIASKNLVRDGVTQNSPLVTRRF